jgi:hypothetical protein
MYRRRAIRLRPRLQGKERLETRKPCILQQSPAKTLLDNCPRAHDNLVANSYALCSLWPHFDYVSAKWYWSRPSPLLAWKISHGVVWWRNQQLLIEPVVLMLVMRRSDSARIELAYSSFRRDRVELHAHYCSLTARSPGTSKQPEG